MLDGYSLGVLYTRYSFWIEGQKGAVIDAMMANPVDVVGYRPQFVPPISFKTYSDYGHFQSGDVRGYCRVAGDGQVDRKDCFFALRAVTIPAAAIDRAGPVGIFMRENFDPEAVVASLKSNGVAADADLWRVDDKQMFETLPSPAALLRGNAKVELVDTRECPAMLRALEEVEGQALPQRIDISLLGEDGRSPPPVPHAAWREDKLTIRADGDFMTITSARGGLQHLLGPVYAAADACLRGRLSTG